MKFFGAVGCLMATADQILTVKKKNKIKNRSPSGDSTRARRYGSQGRDGALSTLV